MANLQIKNINDDFYRKIKLMADAENRSISQHVLYLLKEHLSKQKTVSQVKSPAQVLLDLSGSWDDSADADEIITELKRKRINSKKLTRGF
jgi:plasmid stability protein